MEIIEREKVKSARQEVLEVEPGEIKFYDWSERVNIRTAISAHIKYSHPDRVYTTGKVITAEGKPALKLERIR